LCSAIGYRMGKEWGGARRKVARHWHGACLATALRWDAAVGVMRAVRPRSQTGTPRLLLACCPGVVPVLFPCCDIGIT
jgi:hypothetical protein